MNTNRTMQLIMTTYPGFQDLPKGVKKLLLVSETFFFDQSRTQTAPPVPQPTATAPVRVVVQTASTGSAFAVPASLPLAR